MFRIGVVGYSAQPFDETLAKEIFDEEMKYILSFYPDFTMKDIEIASGLTNMGIPKIAYEWAKSHGVHTIGIAPEEAREYEWFEVDEVHIIGENFGDESYEFVKDLNVLLRVGGGNQSKKEVELADKLWIWTIEREL